jgi:hypothetical protein
MRGTFSLLGLAVLALGFLECGVCYAKAPKNECAHQISHVYVNQPDASGKYAWVLLQVGEIKPDPRLPKIDGANTLAEWYALTPTSTIDDSPPQEAVSLFGECPDKSVADPKSKLNGLKCEKTRVWKVWMGTFHVGTCQYTLPGVSAGGAQGGARPIE